MNETISALIAGCEWDTDPWLLFSQNVFSHLIYYSHLTPIIVSLIFASYIYISNHKSLLNKILLFITLNLSLWLLLDLVLWATDSRRIVLYTWSVINMIEPAIYAGFVYFVIVFVSGKDMSNKNKIWLILPLLPTILTAGTHWNVLGFNLVNCDREVIEGPMAFYNYFIELAYVVWIIVLGFWSWFGTDRKQWIQNISVISVILFLLLGFASGNIIGSFSENWAWGQFGLFVIPVCIGTLSYFIVQFRFFGRSQIMAAQFLVIGLLLAVGSILFLQNLRYVHIITGATLFFLALLGYLLIKSFRHEIELRKEIEKLAKDLEKSNNELERSNKSQVTLIHFITHQLKGFIAKSRNIFSMIQEGDYGETPEPMKAIVAEGFASSTKGALTIQEILNAANIKSGKVAYSSASFDFKELMNSIIAGLKPNADAKGVALTITEPDTEVIFNGDQMQMENAIKNMIDNSIKYTPQGSIKVTLTRESDKIRLVTEDTGVGITPEDMTHLFTEGGHGAESQKVNVDSTGFGLYIVKNIIEGHKGKVWAESDGAGKGSKFIVELPVA